MAVNDDEVLRMAVRQKSNEGTDIVNVYHYKYDGTGDTDAAALSAIAAHFDALYDEIEGQITGAQVPLDIKVDKVALVGGLLKIIENVGTTIWGSLYDPSGAGEAEPLGVCVLIILRTLVGKVFGRKYIGQVNETTIAGNSLATGTPTTAFTNVLPNFLDLITTPNGVLYPGILSTRTLQFEYFNSAAIATEVGYQRRRALRSGS